MKKLLLALTGALALFAFQVANAVPITMNFDTNFQGGIYTEGGMTIDATSAEPVRIGLGPYGYSDSGGWWLDCCDGGPESFNLYTGGVFDLLSIVLVHTDFIDPIVWNGYRDGSLVATATITADIFLNDTLYSFGGFTGLDLVTMSVSGTWTDPMFDDLTFETAVPEPGTLALLGIGILALGMAKRKTAF